LGLDQLVCYVIDKTAGMLQRQGIISLPAGYGPRHLAFHPRLSVAYVMNELMSTVSVMRYDESNASMEAIQHISTLPPSYTESNGTAEIVVSTDGRFVYGSNRGHDSIVAYKVMDNGTLALIQHISSGGAHPRHFTLTPSNEHMLVANRDSNNIVIFKRDLDTGLLSATGNEVYSSKPVCLLLH
jgi:6-phosphogluconolactonase